MIFEDFHTHTTFCDGKNTPAELVEAAYQKGMRRIGVCAHSPTFFDKSYCLRQEKVPLFVQTVRDLAREYQGKIEVYCGVEQDFYSTASTDDYDYVIGSVHYLKIGKEYYAIDSSRQGFIALCQEQYGGDYYRLCEDYYATVAQWAKRPPDLLGHFDLVTKYNEGNTLFDTKHPRYVAAAKAALDALLCANVTFEWNTGAICRGYRTEPYPAEEWVLYLLAHNASLVLSGDAHGAQGLCYDFATWAVWLVQNGASVQTYPAWKRK